MAPRQLTDELRDRTYKSKVLSVAIIFFFSILATRLVYIQVIQADVNIRLSKQNQMKLATIKANRGTIYDRNGVVLARNRPSYSIGILPYKMGKGVDIIGKLLKVKDKYGEPIFDSLTLYKRIHRARYRKFDITRLKEDVSIDLVTIIEEHSLELPGILIQTEARREYPFKDQTFHVLGYTGEIPERKFESLKKEGYHYGDKIGKSGIEKRYEKLLRGKDGYEYLEVNAHGRVLGRIENTPREEPIPGNDLYLTIDSRLQKVAAESFPDSLKGAVVGLNPKTGEVLVMYSNPSVDPNIFSLATSLRSKSWAQAALDSNMPLNNRAIKGLYPPGSTFKLVSATAGVASGIINPNAYMPRPCTGAFRFGSRIAHCWNLHGHGYLNMTDAVKVSCNIYFYQLGLKVGDSTINYYAHKLGLGEYTGIDIDGERKGWLSGKAAYNKRFKKRGWKWTDGLVLDMAIGQTQILTPLQLALMVGGLGNGNVLYKPFLRMETRNPNGILIDQFTPTVSHRLNFDTTVITTIHKAMEKVVMEAGGTGRRVRVPGIIVGGKSGSAENPHGDKTHALFVAVAPLDDPVIAMAAVVENGGHGGTVAAPVIGSVLRYYFGETEEGKEVVEKYKEKSKTK